MGKRKLKHPVSVDSETGYYWYGERKFRTQAQFNMIIKQDFNEQANANNSLHPDQTPIRDTTMKVLRTTSSYFEIKPPLFM